MYCSAALVVAPALAPSELTASALAWAVYSTTGLGFAVSAASGTPLTAKPVPTKASVVAFWWSIWSHTRPCRRGAAGVGRWEEGGGFLRILRLGGGTRDLRPSGGLLLDLWATGEGLVPGALLALGLGLDLVAGAGEGDGEPALDGFGLVLAWVAGVGEAVGLGLGLLDLGAKVEAAPVVVPVELLLLLVVAPAAVLVLAPRGARAAPRAFICCAVASLQYLPVAMLRSSTEPPARMSVVEAIPRGL
jgi:hypothetical protein